MQMEDITIVGSVLQSVQACTERFEFSSRITATKDGTESFYVFREVADVIEYVIFEPNNSLKTLGSYTFYKCSKIKDIDLSNCLKLVEIGASCFSNCGSLSSVRLPDDGIVSSLGTNCFSGSKITNFHLPKSINYCGQYIFSGCYNLENITTVEDATFTSLWIVSFSTSSLSHFKIPKSVNSLGGNSLQATKIKSFEIDPENPYFAVYESNLYSKNFTILHVVNSISKTINFHPNCTSFESRAFMWSAIEEVVIPNNINYFCHQCFYLSKIQRVTILNATEITSAMFYDATQLRNLTLPSNVVTLGAGFITRTKLEYLFVPKSVTKLDEAFKECSSNLVVDFEEGSTFSYEQGYLYNNNKTRLHYYTGNDPSIKIVESVEYIDGSVFDGKSTIISVNFEGTNIKSLGTSCFVSTINLLSIELPSSLQSIGYWCFCKSGLKSIVFPGSVKTISESCFQDCPNLENITISEGVTTLQARSFKNCYNLGTVNFPSTLAIIQDSSFLNSGLKNIIFGPEISRNVFTSIISKNIHSQLKIEKNVFKNSSLESITFTSQVSSLGDSTFEDCKLLYKVDLLSTTLIELPPLTFCSCVKLSTIYLPNTLSSIGDRCFENCGFIRFNIPSYVSQLGSRALGNNLKLVTISLASNTSLSTIVSTSFRGCSSLKEFIFVDKSLNYESIDGVLISIADKMLCVYPPAHECSNNQICDYYEVPANVKAIGPSAFLDSPLTKIKLHQNVNKIFPNAFDNCMKLKKLIIDSTFIEASSLSFQGMVFCCGIFECSTSVAKQLEDVGVPKTALVPCPTENPSLIIIQSLIIRQELIITDE